MGLYQFKEFLTFDDVADYLRDKGIYDFNLFHEYDFKKLRSFMIGLINQGKLTPLFHYHGLVVGFSEAIKGYIDFHDVVDMYIGVLKASNNMIKQWVDGLAVNFTYQPYIPNQVIPKITPKDSYVSFTENPMAYILLDPPPKSGVEFLFSRLQLDMIFDKSTTTTNDNTLQAQLDQAHAKIAELEKQLNTSHQPYKHQNQALQALHDVINEFWQDPSNPPKQEFIKAHITENYPSIDPSKALWIDKIIRHKDK